MGVKRGYYDRGAGALAAERYKVAQGLDSERDPASYIGGAKYRYFEMPAAIFDDTRLEPIDVRAYGILFDAERGGETHISLARIGERIGREAAAAQRSIQRLESAGWLKTVEDTNGRCRLYRLTPLIGEQGTAPKPPPRMEGVIEQTPSADDEGSQQTPSTGDSQPPPSVTKTPPTGGDLSIRSLSVSLARVGARENGSTENKDDDARQSLLEALTRCPLNGRTPEAEADHLLRRFPTLKTLLVAHLNDALAEKNENPIAYADRMTQRGESPKQAVRVA
jgi:hypothetical protein